MASDFPNKPIRLEQAEKDKNESLLLASITARFPELEALFESVNQKWVYEDLMYRFYHQSFKVYGLQLHTSNMVEVLRSLAPHLPMNRWFEDIVKNGTGKVFRDEDNANWQNATRPILEAFFHARYFLEMICKYGKQLTEPPRIMPSGWASVLYLYNLR